MVRQGAQCCDEVVLEIILDVLTIDDTAWRKGATSEEKSENRLREKATVVSGPQHSRLSCRVGGIPVGILAVNDRRLGRGEVTWINAAGG